MILCKCGKPAKLDGGYFPSMWWYRCEDCKITGQPGWNIPDAEDNFRVKVFEKLAGL